MGNSEENKLDLGRDVGRTVGFYWAEALGREEAALCVSLAGALGESSIFIFYYRETEESCSIGGMGGEMERMVR